MNEFNAFTAFNELTAVTRLSLAPDDLRTQLRTLLGQPLRRAGTFAKLSVAGAMSCGEASKELTTALLWSSAFGAHEETQSVLRELSCGVEPMPFDFIATLPVVSAIHAAQHAPSIKFGVFLPAMADAAETWPRLLLLALHWLDEHRCDRVICGWVEEARERTGAIEHISHWLALTRAGLSTHPLANVTVSETAEGDSWKGAEFVPALQAWLTHGQDGTGTTDDFFLADHLPANSVLNAVFDATEFHAGTIRFACIEPD